MKFSLCRTTLLGLCFALLGSLSLGQELLENTAFDRELDKVQDWVSVIHKEYQRAKASPPAVVRKERQVPYVEAVVPYKAASHYFNIHQDVDLENGVVYQLVLEARYLGEGVVRVALASRDKNVNAGMAVNLPTDGTWRRFQVTFKPDKISDEHLPGLYISFGSGEGTAQVRKVSLVKYDGDEKPVRNKAKELPLAGSVAAIPLPQLLAEFEADAAAAAAKYKDKFVPISAPIVAVGPGPNSSTTLFTLEFGKIKLIGLASDLGKESLKELSAAVGKANAKVGAMRRSPKWKTFSPEEREGHMRGVYPTLHAGASISGYKGGVLQCGRSRDLGVQYP